MYLIVGLGNPEPEYAKTRHNMGFETINKLADKYSIQISKSKFEGLYGTGTIEEQRVILVKPQTYMNLSGDCIKKFVNFYQIPLEHVLVIYDDIDLEKGSIKIRKKGGPGTHNGMKSVVLQLNSTDFPRIRVGIGCPEYKQDMINYVIGKLTEEEYKKLEQATKKASEAIGLILKENIEKAMNQYN